MSYRPLNHRSPLLALSFLLCTQMSPLLAQYEKIDTRAKQSSYDAIKEHIPSDLARVISPKSILGREVQYPHRFILARKGVSIISLDQSTKEITQTKTLSSKQKKAIYDQAVKAANVKKIPSSYLKKIRPNTIFSQEEIRASFPAMWRDFAADYILYLEPSYALTLQQVAGPDGEPTAMIGILPTRPATSTVVDARSVPATTQNLFAIPSSMESALHRELQWDLISQLSRLLADRLNSCLYLYPLDATEFSKGTYTGKFIDRPLHLSAPAAKDGARIGPKENLLSGMAQQIASSMGQFYPSLLTVGSQQPTSHLHYSKDQDTELALQQLELIVPAWEKQLDGKRIDVLYLAQSGGKYSDIARQDLEHQAEQIKQSIAQLQRDYARFVRENPIHHPAAGALVAHWTKALDSYAKAVVSEGGSLDKTLTHALKSIKTGKTPSPQVEKPSKKAKKAKAPTPAEPLYLGTEIKPLAP